jgi:hypothetical protein
MTKEQLESLLKNTTELDPVWVEHFWNPLRSLQAATEKTYRPEAPPKFFGEAREFAGRLWECVDDAEMKSLVAGYPEGAAQFSFLIHLLIFQLLAELQGKGLGIEPRPDKPFAALAFRGQEWLDAVEASNPGKTTRPS